MAGILQSAVVAAVVGTSSLCTTVVNVDVQPDEPNEPEVIEQTNPLGVLPAGPIPAARLIDLAAKRSGVVIKYDPSQLSRSVTIRSDRPLDTSELWTSIGRILATQNLAIVDSGSPGEYEVVTLANAKAAAGIRNADEARDPPVSYEYVIVEIVNTSPTTIAGAVSPLMTQQHSVVQPLPETSLLLLGDRTDRIDAALKLIERMDGPGREIGLRRVPVEDSDPVRVATELQRIAVRLVRSAGGTSPVEIIPGDDGDAVLLIGPVSELDRLEEIVNNLDVSKSAVTRSHRSLLIPAVELSQLLRTFLSSGEGSGPDTRITVSRATESVLVTASSGTHARIDRIITELERDFALRDSTVVAVQMHHRPAREILDLLNDLGSRKQNELPVDGLSPSPAGTPQATSDNVQVESPPPSVASTSGGTVALPALDQLSVSVDESTNSLIVSGDPLLVRQLERVVRVLDVPTPQVLLEVMLVSLTESETLDLGVELTKLIDDAGTIVGLSSLFGLTSITANSTDALPGGNGGTAVVLDPGDFSVVVRALETVNDGRSLSMPRLLVLNNQEGTFDSVLQQPFTSTNASDTVATTSFGGSSDAGTQVSVRPQIVAGDRITLEYAIGLSAFTGEATDPNLPPPRQENSLASTATIPDSFVVALGGIELKTEGDGESRTPGLSRIPLVGELFKSRSRSDSRTRFYVFIRATVLRNESLNDLKYIGGREAERAGIDDGWPEVAPRVIR